MQAHEQRAHDEALDRAVNNSEEMELESYEVRIELDTPLNDLFSVIRQAVSELENQGEKSQRIAEQLLRGMASFCKQTGCM